MDRFEDDNLAKKVVPNMIYIPVWIDLKFNQIVQFGLTDPIYIPVWIDLKSRCFVYRGYIISHLHSSMDRFEAPNVCRRT